MRRLLPVPRESLSLALAVSIAAPSLSCSRGVEPVPPPPGELRLVVAREILTMDDAMPSADAMLVGSGRILELGTEARLREAYPKAHRVDFGDAVILPGFIDSHVHLREFGERLLRADLQGVESVDEMIERLRDKYPHPEPGEWLVGAGWDEGAWASRGYPDRAALDAAFPDNPVALHSLHGFAGFFNGAALQAAGVGPDTPDPEGGQFLRRPDGRLSGVALSLAQDRVEAQMPPLDLEARRDAIRVAMDALAEAGVTSVHEAGANAEDIEAFRSLAAESQLPLRVALLVDANDRTLAEQWLERGPTVLEGERLRIAGFKIFFDGSLGSRTAWMHVPYHDAPRANDAVNATLRTTPEWIETVMERSAEQRFVIAVHAIGDAANDHVLEAWSRTATRSKPEARLRLEHAQVVSPGFFERAAALGVIASMQPSHAVGDSAWAEQRVGPQRIDLAYAWRSMLDAGVHLALNSDLPGEPWRPNETLYFAVQRAPLDAPEARWHPEQAIDVSQALRGMTAEGAYAAWREGDLGSLTPGKWADYVVLDHDPRRIPSEELSRIEVLERAVAGETDGRFEARPLATLGPLPAAAPR